MKKTFCTKKAMALICCLVLAALLALPVFAQSPNTEAVLKQLDYLKKVDISPQWLPDIRANQSSVQHLLDLYEECTMDERAEFTQQELDDLREYFEALYTVQGKDTAGLDVLFEITQGETPDDSSLPPEVEPDEPDEPSSLPQEASSEISTPAPGEVVDPQSSSTPESQYVGTTPPSVPKGGGWLSIFGSDTVGITILVVLAAIVAVLFIRFLVALRKVGKDQKDENTAEFRKRELFGDDYTVDTEGADSVSAAGENGEAPQKPAPLPPMPEKQKKENKRQRRRKNKNGEAEQEQEEKSEALIREEKFDDKGEGVILDIKHPLPPLGGDDVPEEDDSPQTPDLPELANRGGFEQPKNPHPQFGSNPERQNSITMRSFSSPPRTGKPPKQPFRQGSPDDLDAIDE